MRRWVAIIALLCAAGVQAQKPQNTAELEQALKKILADNHVPAAGVAVVDRNGTQWEAGLGQDSGRPVTADSMFRIGSISKSFVALSVLMLREQGRVRLDDPVGQLAPEIAFFNPWERTDPVRLVNLLEHTAGFDDLHLREYAHNYEPNITLREGLALNPKSRSSRWKPGAFFSYSNSGPAVAAYVVEKIAGQRYEDFVRERLFEPLEMPGASFFLTPETRARLVKSYGSDGSESPYSHIMVRPSGAVNASAHEMAHFVRLFLQRGSYAGRQLVQPASIERMETPVTTLAARLGVKDGYGLNNSTTFRNGYTFHGHNGAIDGFLAGYAYLAEEGRGYVFMINAFNGKAFRGIDELLRNYVTRDLPKLPPPAVASVSTADLERWTGFYEPLTPRSEMMRFMDRITGIYGLRLKDGKLYTRTLFGPEALLLPVTNSQFRRADDPVATWAFTEDGSGDTIVTGRWNGRKIASWQIRARFALATLSLLGMASTVLFAAFWALLAMVGRPRDWGPLSVRLLPFLAALALAAQAALVATGDLVSRFGRPTVWSLAFFLLTLLFPAFAVGGLIQVLRFRGSTPRGVWIHSLLAALSAVLVAVYLNFYGMIGFTSWK
jgi:CubicO group peptidase (beta-lactamase class C family)